MLYTKVANDCVGGNCQRAYQWNLDRSRTPTGNVVSFYYDQERNTYNGGTSYVRAAYLTRIEYGNKPGSEDIANTRVLFNTRMALCGTASQDHAFSDCADDLNANFPDTPLRPPLRLW